LKHLTFILIPTIIAFGLLIDYGTSFGQLENIQEFSSSTNKGTTITADTQNLNNLNQAQLIDLIATEISNANNIDKTTLILGINDLSEKTKAKGGNEDKILGKLSTYLK
jgi:hypothetical protein